MLNFLTGFQKKKTGSDVLELNEYEINYEIFDLKLVSDVGLGSSKDMIFKTYETKDIIKIVGEN